MLVYSALADFNLSFFLLSFFLYKQVNNKEKTAIAIKLYTYTTVQK